MTDLPPVRGSDAVAAGLTGAHPDQQQQAEDAKRTAEAISAAFDRAGESIAKSLARAASDGKISLAELASVAISALESFGKTAVAGAGGGLGGLSKVLGSLFSSVFSGAKADGGPVTPGGAYLVGAVVGEYQCGKISPHAIDRHEAAFFRRHQSEDLLQSEAREQRTGVNTTAAGRRTRNRVESLSPWTSGRRSSRG